MRRRRSGDAIIGWAVLSNGRGAVESAVAGRFEFAGKRIDVEVASLTAETADPENHCRILSESARDGARDTLPVSRAEMRDKGA